MPLTFAEVKDRVAPYAGRAGKAPSARDTAIFAHDVMNHLLKSGADAAIRKVYLRAAQGLIALPPDVETPLKARIGHAVAEVGNRWAEFRSGSQGFEDCPPVGSVLSEEGTRSPLVYSLPRYGSVVGVEAHCEETGEVIIQGTDVTGRPIFMPLRGEQSPGERLSLKKGKIQYGKAEFADITGVIKPKTNGYVTLYAVNPKTDSRLYLADWGPNETRPMYRRFRVISRNCAPIVDVEMLCRVKLKDTYHDNDLTLFDSGVIIMMAAKQLQSELNDDSVGAANKKNALDVMLEQESGYKKVSGNPIDVFFPLSGGSIKNIL